MIVYFIGLYIVSLLLGYDTAFSEATLMIGKSINDTDSRTGYQDAITPRILSILSFVLYGVVLAWIVYGFIKYGWLVGLGIIVGFLFLMSLNKVILLPKKDSEHFRRIITGSMIRRYANYLRDGDELRASAMKALLEKLDIPVSELISEETNIRLEPLGPYTKHFLQEIEKDKEREKAFITIANSPETRNILEKYGKGPEILNDIYWRLMASGTGEEIANFVIAKPILLETYIKMKNEKLSDLKIADRFLFLFEQLRRGHDKKA